MKLLSILLSSLFVSISLYASVPVRDLNGCFVGSTGVSAYGFTENTIALAPFYLALGKFEAKTTISPSPRNPDVMCPPITHTKRELLIPLTHRVVGHEEHVFSDTWISVPTENEVKFFPFNDVFVESTEAWSFKDLRGK